MSLELEREEGLRDEGRFFFSEKEEEEV